MAAAGQTSRQISEQKMSPQINTLRQPLVRHPQRPWRPVESEPRRSARAAARSFSTPVVRELPPRRDQRTALGTW